MDSVRHATFLLILTVRPHNELQYDKGTSDRVPRHLCWVIVAQRRDVVYEFTRGVRTPAETTKSCTISKRVGP